MPSDSGGGSTITYAHTNFTNDHWVQVRGSQKVNEDLWIYPCATKLPDIKVSIGNGKSPVAIPGNKLNGGGFGQRIHAGMYKKLLLSVWLHCPMAFSMRLRVTMVTRLIVAYFGGLQSIPHGRYGILVVPFWISAFVVFNQSNRVSRLPHKLGYIRLQRDVA